MCLFFKRKTAYEMRISDWSSDVCSSDLVSNGPLGSGESYSRTVDFTMPPGVEGEYYVYVIANSAGRNPIAGDIVRSGSNSGLLGQFSKYAFELPQGNLGQASFPVVYAEPDLRDRKSTRLNSSH